MTKNIINEEIYKNGNGPTIFYHNDDLLLVIGYNDLPPNKDVTITS